jgi:hypothetical protein
MKNSNWKDTAELIGIAAIVASLIFVGLQLRQDQEIAVSQIYADWDDTRIDWARLVNENDDVWIRALRGDELDEREFLRFESVANAWYHMENGRYIRAGRISLASPEGVARSAAYFLFSNAGLKAWWNARHAYRVELNGRQTPPFPREVNRILSELESGERLYIERDSYAPL